MSTVSRGVRAVIGLVAGFLTLIFISQMFRYLPIAISGDPLSLGMAGIYVILTYLGLTVTILLFKTELRVWKYLAGVGLGVGGLLFVSAVYLFTLDISSGLMLLIFTVVQVGVSGLVYGVGIYFRGSNEETPDPEANNQTPTNHDMSSQSEPWWTTGIFDLELWREIDWLRMGQVIVGAFVIVLGGLITIQSPVGVPVLLFGFILIPAVRNQIRERVGKY